MRATRVNRLLISASASIVLLASCKGHDSSDAIPQADTNWSWEGGANVSNGIGNYISLGSATSTGMPSSRVGAMTWVDSVGQFWVFSGSGGASDVWSFNISTLQWTWQAGNASVTIPSPGIYDTPIGTATSTNLPGQRSFGATWRDGAGDFWMFGGYGTDSNGLIGYMNDIWSFSPSTKWWTWQGGGNSAGSLAATPNWGTINVPATSNQPNARSNSAYWTGGTTSNPKFYMFGGEGYLSGNTAVQNDLWQYDPSNKLWTWIGGTQSLNPIGVYGTKGQFLTSNQPGGRQSATTWTDSKGNFWMFGGIGIDCIGANGYLNDLWQYSPASNTWAWMNGAVTINNIGSYGTNAVATSSNQPGSRSGAIGWVDSTDNFWLFGGYGINSLGSVVVLNDLWEYISATQQWVWVNGSYYGNATGVYGSIDILSQYNIPGSRYGGAAWKDAASGNFWMYAGAGFDALGTNGRLSDVWRFIP